jgi:transitional endoplasmic reticulum ATPase
LPYKKYRNKDWYIYKAGDATKHSLRVLYNLAVQNNLLNKEVEKEFDLLQREDIGWEKIEEIEKYGKQELFDFTVDKDSFVGGPYFFMHNSKFYGESEANLRKIFEEAEKNAPAIIFIDEIDSLAPKREEVKGEVERRVVAQMLALMDGLKSRGKVVVIAATNVPNILDPALRRPGRFDREIEIGVPDKKGRLKIMQIHARNMPITSDPEKNGFNIKEKDAVKILGEILEKSNQAKLIADIQKEKISKPRDLIYDELKDGLKSLNKETDGTKLIRRCLFRIAEELNNSLIYKEKNIDKEESEKQIAAKIDELKSEGKIKEIISLSVRNLVLEDIAEITYGFVGADLSALAKEAAMGVLRKILPDIELKEKDQANIPKEVLEKLWITKEDFIIALRTVRPSALREVFIEKPTTTWDDVGGLDDVKQDLKEAVELPLNKPEVFKRMGIRPPKGILLYGAPGTGKTLLARAVAHESKANFIAVKGPELMSKWVGESEKAVREVFKKARQSSPTIVFFDEIDALAQRRGISSDSRASELVVNQILTEIDGLEELNNVVVIGATNRPDIVDPALLRPGRFDRIILTPAPDKETRKKIFKVHTKGMPVKNIDVDKLAEETEGYVGADIESVCREAAMLALRKNIAAKEVTMVDFKKALEVVRPSVTKEVEQTYEELKQGFKAATAKQMRQESPSYFG